MLFLQDHGVSTAFAAKIYRQYGNESIQKVRENPFRLADDIWGIGFKTADSIAMKLGIGKEAFIRLRSGIMYTLSELADEGHVYAEREQLIRKASELLEAEDTSIIMTMDQMLKDEELIREKIMVPQFAPDEVIPEDAAKEVERECIYLPPFYYAEVGVANKLKKLSEEPAGDRLWVSLMRARQKTGNPELSVDVEKIQKAVNMEYDQVQAEAIRRAATAKVLVLTGGPGTGKTTTTQGIIAAYRTFGLRILLAAPTGRAAKRMTEATGLEARTIHRLLEFKPPEGYQKNEETPLEGDVLIVDECSMIDIVLMNALMKAIPPHMRLILVGDIDQLPSVGAGNVLRDVIDSEVFPVVRLTRIFRQAQTSRIIMNAHKINAGEMPDTSNGKSTDFFFMTKEDPEDAARLIVELVNKKLPGYYRTPASQIQVLTPMQRGVVGATNLNMALQEALNPKGEGLRRSGFVYRPNDKVMQIKNNYDKEVFNGDIGIIESVDLQDRTLLVNFDGRSIEYDATELDELVHAYATTIHKAQGSEYPIVVMPVLMNHFVMLQRNLLYTGVTRAKKILVLVGEKKAVYYAIKNETTTGRNTCLARRLQSDSKEAQEVKAQLLKEAVDEAVNGKGSGSNASVNIQQKKEKMIVYKGSIQPSMVCETPAVYEGNLWKRLSQSKFRSSFSLKANDRSYVLEKGMEKVREHACDFIRKRLAPAEIPNDGKQTPMRGHPVFVAQHATATCCRGCLEKWHRIPKGRELTEAEQEYIVNVIMEWIGREIH